MQIILNCPGQGADAKTGKQVPVHASINASLLSMTGTVFLGGRWWWNEDAFVGADCFVLVPRPRNEV